MLRCKVETAQVSLASRKIVHRRFFHSLMHNRRISFQLSHRKHRTNFEQILKLLNGFLRCLLSYPTPARGDVIDTFAWLNHAIFLFSWLLILTIFLVQNCYSTVFFFSVANHLTRLFSFAAQLVAWLPLACEPHRTNLSFITRCYSSWFVPSQLKTNIVVNDSDRSVIKPLSELTLIVK